MKGTAKICEEKIEFANDKQQLLMAEIELHKKLQFMPQRLGIRMY